MLYQEAGHFLSTAFLACTITESRKSREHRAAAVLGEPLGEFTGLVPHFKGFREVGG